jgi:phosphonatase-like hydrolase
MKFIIPKNTKMIVFDMAGTTVEEKGIVYDTLFHTLKQFGKNITKKEIEQWHGFNKYEVLEHYISKNKTEEIYNVLKSQLFTNFENNLMNAYSVPSNISMMDKNMGELFESIRNKDIKVALNTGYPNFIRDKIINSLDMKHMIDDCISSNEVPQGRPSPYMIQELMKRNQIDSAFSVIKVGDTPVDIQEGQNAKCGLTIGVLSGAGNSKELYQSKANCVIRSVMDMEIQK